MSELRGAYIVDTSENTGMDLPCPTCGAVIGKMVDVGSRVMLLVGRLYVYHLDGYCESCGHEYHWSSSSQKLDRLVARMVRRRENV